MIVPDDVPDWVFEYYFWRGALELVRGEQRYTLKRKQWKSEE